jgi:hypothetical protein
MPQRAARKSKGFKPFKQGILRRNSLLIGILDGMADTVSVGRIPAAIVHVDAAAFYLDNDQSNFWMDEEKIRFSVSLAAVAEGLPAYVMQNRPIVSQSSECVCRQSL